MRPPSQALRAQIRHLATFDTVGSAFVPTLLLQGETGTGKGLVARVIHDSGPRAQGPFVEVNCAAIPETLLEVELFGFEAGTFTDARRAKPGLVESAAHGTLFLDEIDALPLLLQSKLLSAIDEKRVRRLGAVASRQLDVKFIAATPTDLSVRVTEGHFRPDLYHRLAVVLLEIPPLRERGEDILVLAQHFVRQYAAGAWAPAASSVSRDAEAWLQGYGWPGNVRELSHLMERVTLLSTRGRRHRPHPGAAVPAATAAGRPIGGASGPWRGRAPGRAGTDTPGPQPDGGQRGAGGAPPGDQPWRVTLLDASVWHWTSALAGVDPGPTAVENRQAIGPSEADRGRSTSVESRGAGICLGAEARGGAGD